MREYFLRLYNKTNREYIIKLSKYLDNNEKKFVVTANPETFTLAESDAEIKKILLNENNDVIPDGIAIVKCARHYKIDVKERITGCDMMVELLELANQKKKSIYLFGAEEEVLASLVNVIKKKYPRIKILGYKNGYEENKDAVFEDILEKKPDVCFVALGIPLQEKLINKYIGRAKKGIFIGVGGSFDVISGKKRRAPKIFIKLNLEWLYRLIKEPKRIKRFYNNNIKFVFRVLFDKS